MMMSTERGEFEVRIKVRDRLSKHILDYHPFDVVGWDGYLYPWIFNIEDFEPITGRVHQPPPVHQTFQAHNFVVCSFVPRLFDYHPESIPAPYNHSNVNSDEIIYYAEGDFMSRKGIDRCDISMHPYGLAHGPQPGMTEASIGKKETKERFVSSVQMVGLLCVLVCCSAIVLFLLRFWCCSDKSNRFPVGGMAIEHG